MALRLLLCRNKWKTKKAGILLGSINHRLCHTSPSSTTTTTTTTTTTLGPHVHVPERSLTNDYGGDSFHPKISPELYIQLRQSLVKLGGAVDVPDAHKDDRMIFFAQFAVFMINETNTRRDNSKRLEFVRVVSAKVQLVHGLIYYVTLEAASIDDDGRVTKFYEAKFLDTNVCLTLQSWSELESPPTTTQSSLD